MRDLVIDHADEWVQVGSQFKGFDPSHPSVGGEEWLGGPYPTAAWIYPIVATSTAVAAATPC